jgi:Icc-related predicted phosphoesterase
VKLNFVNDIHLEFGELPENPSGSDVLVLAGDVTIKNRVDWINEIANNFKHVVYVLGNHEFYHQNLDNTYRKTKEQLADNVYLLQNESVTLDGIAFHGTTLWSDFDQGNPLSYFHCENAVNDFRSIRADNGKSRFTPQRAHKEHNVAKGFLRENVKKGDVVVTHHGPTYKSLDDKHRGDDINGAYVSDLADLIMDLDPVLWFHGHLHNTSDYTVGNTRVLCNPRGYVGHEINNDFDVHKFVEI